MDEPHVVAAGGNGAPAVARPRGLWLGLVLSALAGAVVAGLVAYLMWPTPPTPRVAAPPPAAPAPAAPVAPPPATTPSPTEAPTSTVASSPAETPSATGPPARPVTTESPRETPAPSLAVPLPSRSRGRTDWLFFFKTGDRLARMSDEAPVGLVLRTERSHTFPDGTAGPAYLLQMPEGGQRFMDADELERGSRLE